MKEIEPIWMQAIRAEVDEKIRAESEAAGQMTLGQVIDAMKALPQDAKIVIDNGYSPSDFESYRGYYEQLSIDFSDQPRTVKQTLEEAQSACGATMTGYKGGDYVMHRGTMVWASAYGSASGLRVVKIEMYGDKAIIRTKRED